MSAVLRLKPWAEVREGEDLHQPTLLRECRVEQKPKHGQPQDPSPVGSVRESGWRGTSPFRVVTLPPHPQWTNGTTAGVTTRAEETSSRPGRAVTAPST